MFPPTPCFANRRSFQYSVCRTPCRAETRGSGGSTSFFSHKQSEKPKFVSLQRAGACTPCPVPLLSKTLHLPFPDGETAAHQSWALGSRLLRAMPEELGSPPSVVPLPPPARGTVGTTATSVSPGITNCHLLKAEHYWLHQLFINRVLQGCALLAGVGVV